jgi:citrate synthase
VKSGIASTTADAIIIRGRNLSTELMGRVGFTDMMLLCSLGRLPSPQERAVVDTVAVSLMDHGITPSSLAARLTLLGAPESFQAAVAAGLLGAGSTFLGGMTDVAKLLNAALDSSDLSVKPDASTMDAVADDVVRRVRAEGRRLPGLGHNVHTSADPRVDRMRHVVRDNGFYGPHWQLMDALPDALERATGKQLPINNVGGVGATISALGYPPELGRGIALAARAAGLAAHLLEEAQEPIAQQAWESILAVVEKHDDVEVTGR